MSTFSERLDGRITVTAPYGKHIGLTCENHPELSWSTKNIGGANEDGTGVYFARSIFFNYDGVECSCAPSLLRVHPDQLKQPEVAP